MTLDTQHDQVKPAARSRIAALILADGLLGLAAGLFFRSWQIAIEPAQTLAGLVTYPPWNPEFRYHTGTWTLLNQLAAAGLGAGWSEAAVSTLLSGLAGAVAFPAIALVAFAICRRPVVAFVAPLILLYARGGPWFSGITYTIYLFGYPWTYGMIGLSAVLFVLGLVGCGEMGWAGFAAAVTVAVHPALGIWLGAMLAIVALIDHRWIMDAARRSWWLWAVGVAITGASFFAYRANAPAIAPDARDGEFFAAFIRHWDSHRQVFPLSSAPMAEAIAAVAASILLLHLARREGNRGIRALAVAVISSVGLGLLFSVSYWLPPERMPALILALMPSRVPNIGISLALIITVALLADRRRGSEWLLLATLAALVGNSTFGFLHKTALVVAIECIALVLLFLMTSYRGSRPPARHSGFNARAATLVTIVLVLLVGHLLASVAGTSRPRLLDRTNHRFWRFVSSRDGTLVGSPGIYMVQARSRRPVLLNPYSLDYLPFTPGVGSSVERILRDVYGIDLLDPPSDLKAAHRGGLRPEDGRELWQERRPQQWSALRRAFGITDVLCPVQWRLALRPVASGEGLVLYEIPP